MSEYKSCIGKLCPLYFYTRCGYNASNLCRDKSLRSQLEPIIKERIKCLHPELLTEDGTAFEFEFTRRLF